MKSLSTVLFVIAVGVCPAWAALVDLPLDQQINLGLTYNTQSPSGDAIYPAFNADTQTFFPGSHVRHNMTTVPASWWYQYLDLNLAGVTTPGNGLDLSAAGATISFDTRYYQDALTNTNPYGDAPVFLRLYTYAADGNTYVGHRDYGIVYATQTPLSNPPYPEWTTVTVGISTSTYSDGGTFDVANVSRIRWYGTDWSGGGEDFVDFRNVVITPEPASLILAALGAVLLRRRSRA